MILELTKEEAKALLAFIDLGVKASGLAAVNGAFVLSQKIQKAQIESENKESSDMPP